MEGDEIGNTRNGLIDGYSTRDSSKGESRVNEKLMERDEAVGEGKHLSYQNTLKEGRECRSSRFI